MRKGPKILYIVFASGPSIIFSCQKCTDKKISGKYNEIILSFRDF